MYVIIVFNLICYAIRRKSYDTLLIEYNYFAIDELYKRRNVYYTYEGGTH